MTEHTTVGGIDLNTGDLALEGGDRADQVRIEVLALQLGHGVTKGLGRTLHSEGGDDNVVQHRRVGGHRDVDRLAVEYDFLGHVTEAVDLQRLAVPHSGKGERTVCVSHCTYGSPIDDDGSTDHGLTVISFDDTLRDVRLGERNGRDAERQDHEKGTHHRDYFVNLHKSTFVN